MRTGLLVCLLVLVALVACWSVDLWGLSITMTSQAEGTTTEPPLRQIEGFIIALDPLAPHVRRLAESTATHLLGKAPRVWRAVNGTDAVAVPHSLPLYTRLTLVSGRHDHMQIGSPEMLGCLMSHVAVWRHVDARRLPHALVLEEDAQIDAVSAERLTQLLFDVRDEPWDILLLETGHLTVSGATRGVGQLGLTWRDPADAAHNRWMGTRGYVLTRRGAETLLRHAGDLSVQVDALLGMAVVFDGLRMVWPWVNIAHPTRWRPSTVQAWDPCIRCFVPSIDGATSVLTLVFLGAALGLVSYKRWTSWASS